MAKLIVLFAVLNILNYSSAATTGRPLEVNFNGRTYQYVGEEQDTSKISFPSNQLTEQEPQEEQLDLAATNSVHSPSHVPDALKQQEVPEQVLIKMKDLTDPSSFISSLVYAEPEANNGQKRPGLAYLQRGYGSPTATDDATGQGGTTPSAANKAPKMPKVTSPAGCAVELRTVEIEPPKDNELYYPWCVRLPRCSGCCPSARLECVPTNISIIEVTAIRLQYAKFNKKFRFEGVKVFQMERHEACSCQCIQQPKDCTSYQVYKPEECRCVCKDSNEANDCLAQPLKEWSKENCSCSCRQRQTCSTGLVFNHRTCRCESTGLVVRAARRIEPSPSDVAALPSRPSTDSELKKQSDVKGQPTTGSISGINPDIDPRTA